MSTRNCQHRTHAMPPEKATLLERIEFVRRNPPRACDQPATFIVQLPSGDDLEPDTENALCTEHKDEHLRLCPEDAADIYPIT